MAHGQQTPPTGSKSMKIGFTGTQRGTTQAQRAMIINLLEELDVEDFHHGDCIGADDDAHDIAMKFQTAITIHPPTDSSKRAFCTSPRTTILPPKAYLVRNHAIVAATECLIATPGSFAEQVRSGTWATIRYACKANKPVFIVFPDGTIEQ